MYSNDRLRGEKKAKTHKYPQDNKFTLIFKKENFISDL